MDDKVGTMKDLPKCLYCEKTLSPSRKLNPDAINAYNRYIPDPDRRGYLGDNLFCSLSCGYEYVRRIIIKQIMDNRD